MSKIKIKETGLKVVGLTAGAVVAGFAQRIPVNIDSKFKSAAAILLGAVISGKKGILGDVGAGMIAKGGSDLVASFGIGGFEGIINGFPFVKSIPMAGLPDPLNGLEDDAIHTDDQVM